MSFSGNQDTLPFDDGSTFENKREKEKNLALLTTVCALGPQVRHTLPPGATMDAAALRSAVIPVLLMACNRVTVRRSLDLLFRYRPSADLHPLIVSQDCGHGPTAAAIQSYGKRLVHMRQPDLSGFNLPVAIRRFEGYYKISRHYKWALDQVFLVRNYSAVIIVEDDLEISPDFFEYFRATYPILRTDPSLFCVSAWNDNGKANLIADDSNLLHRTDFFPGLGWMLLRELWMEIRSKWPAAFWDEYMRRPEVRRGRACIQPEISRSSTFGRIGVSNGQFFDKHLKFIRLNSRFVPFTRKDMSYLMRTAYDANFEVDVYSSPELRLDQVLNGERPELGAVRLTYASKEEFRAAARRLGLMDDFKAGVPRTAYRGVVSVFFRRRRVYLAPRRPWRGYDLKWT